jgi:hypothetical protein
MRGRKRIITKPSTTGYYYQIKIDQQQENGHIRYLKGVRKEQGKFSFLS